jgi:RNA polymerase sigma factor (sigma-70 family)
MGADDKRTGGSGGRFPATSPTLMEAIRSPGTAAFEEARRRLIMLYWEPVYCQIRRKWGRGVEDAKDLTQEFFLSKVLEGALASRFDPARGSFRAFLRTALSNFMADQAESASRIKRGGGADRLILDAEGVEELVADVEGLRPEDAFDAAWRNVILRRALELCRKRLIDAGKPIYFEIFRLHDVEGEAGYKSVAARVGLGLDAVKNHLTAARKVFERAAQEVIAEYADDPAAVSAEMKELFGM